MRAGQLDLRQEGEDFIVYCTECGTRVYKYVGQIPPLPGDKIQASDFEPIKYTDADYILMRLSGLQVPREGVSKPHPGDRLICPICSLFDVNKFVTTS